MNVLFVDPEYKRITENKNNLDDESLLYPPLGLMKLIRFHKDRGDKVKFVRGCDKSIYSDLFNEEPIFWHRIYITTLFTYNFKNTVKTINFYKDAVGKKKKRIFIDSIMNTLIRKKIYNEKRNRY